LLQKRPSPNCPNPFLGLNNGFFRPRDCAGSKIEYPSDRCQIPALLSFQRRLISGRLLCRLKERDERYLE